MNTRQSMTIKKKKKNRTHQLASCSVHSRKSDLQSMCSGKWTWMRLPAFLSLKPASLIDTQAHPCLPILRSTSPQGTSPCLRLRSPWYCHWPRDVNIFSLSGLNCRLSLRPGRKWPLINKEALERWVEWRLLMGAQWSDVNILIT